MVETDAPRGTILIVDDEEDIRRALRLMLEVESFEVVGEAGTGPEATIIAGEYQPQFIILDYRMPGMTGEETAGLLRRISPDSKIIAFSAFLEGEPEWADAYLDKDRINELTPLLERLAA